MKKTTFLKLKIAALGLCISASALAQNTAGTLTFKFTPKSHTCYTSGTAYYLAVWIETGNGSAAGTFVKSIICTGSASPNKPKESDHLPNWAKASSNGGTSSCISTSCNRVDAVSNATLNNWNAQNLTWDSKNVTATANGTVVADGNYQVVIEECWDHGGTALRRFGFKKGTATDHQTPAADNNFTAIDLNWVASGIGINENALSEVSNLNIFPNPSNNGIFNVNFSKANNLKVVNTLGMTVVDEKIAPNVESTSIDLSKFENGIYFVYIVDGDKTSMRKVVVNK